MTWNIHGSVGADRRCDPERTLRVIRENAPDILALQEVDGRTRIGRMARAFERMEDALGDHVVEARTVLLPGEDHGHLLWSRWPVRISRLHSLPGGRYERRMAIEAVCETPGGPLRVVAAHFGLLPWDRARSAAQIAALAHGSLPTVILGDLNEWRLKGPVHRALTKVLPQCVAARTFPARSPVVSLDRIYAAPAGLIEGQWVDRSAADASDHLPLVATLNLRSALSGEDA